jgi:hypothetical protein
MPRDHTAGRPTTRRYSVEEKQSAVRMVRSSRPGPVSPMCAMTDRAVGWLTALNWHTARRVLGDMTIGDGARIGANAIVMRNVTPGKTVSAGTVLPRA